MSFLEELTRKVFFNDGGKKISPDGVGPGGKQQSQRRCRRLVQELPVNSCSGCGVTDNDFRGTRGILYLERGSDGLDPGRAIEPFENFGNA